MLQLQRQWGAIAAQCVGRGDRAYRLAGMYIEFENMSDDVTAVTPPSFERTEGIEYYAGLADSLVRDYLRVPLLLTPDVDVVSGDEALFPDPLLGNLLRVQAITSGTAGVHGRTFSAAEHSRVFGIAIVATPVFADPTRDLVFARGYFDDEDQLLMPTTGQLTLTAAIPFS